MEKLGVVFGLKRTALMLFFVSITAFFASPPAHAAKSVTLAWDASTDSSVTGYKLYYGPGSGNYTNAVTLGNVTSGTIPNLVEGATYYFGVTAFNTVGESGYANEVAYTIPITPVVNQPPTLNTIANATFNEDASAQTVNLSGIGTGGENQALIITATSSNPGLIPNPTVNYSSPNATGALTLTPVANANGTATITVTVNDGQAANNIVTRQFTVTVNAVNDAPTLNALGNLTVSENASQQTVSLAGIGSGAANETQTLAITATSSNPGLIPNPTVGYTSPNATGSLSFTPVADANGTATITVTVNDGQSANNTMVRTFTVTVNGVNNAPTLNAIANVTVNEDASAQTVNLSGIGTGAANESQTLTVTATSSNPGLVPNPSVTYSSPNVTGSLAFTPAADANGTATITVTVNDGQAANNTVVRTFTVTVNAVNDAPTLNVLNNLSIADNAGLQTVNLSGIGSGAANESQTLAVTAMSSNPALIPNPTITYSSPAATGSIRFTPTAGGSGTATITVTINDGQAANNTVVRTFTVNVNAINNAPTLNAIANVTINEDASAQSVGLTGIGSGANYESQALALTATSSNPGLIPNPTVNYSSPNATGSLNFTPVTDANGTATITVTVNDGQAQNNTVVRTFNVTVNALNDQPTLNSLVNLNVAENASQQTVNLSGIGSGAANESQTLAITATSSNPGLIPNPAVSYASPNTTGALTFKPATDANGTATITVTINDGQAQNNTLVRTFTVTVNGVNNPPTLNQIANVSVNEDAGAQTVSLAGIGSGAANETQTLMITATSSNPGLVPNPTVNYSSPNATGSLSFTPAANANGTATITVTINDGQSENNTVTRTFNVTVNSLNDTPTLDTIAGLSFGGPAPNAMLPKTVTLTGIGSGAANENQTITVTASSSNPAIVPHPTVNYTSPNTSGTITVAPSGTVNGTAVITVTVNDGQPQNNIVTRAFAVTVNVQNGTPTISAIANQTTVMGTPTPAVSFVIGDGETPAGSLTLTASSSNPALVTVTNIVFGGSESNRTVTITPEPNQIGNTDIAIAVSDGVKVSETVFRLDVVQPTPASMMTLVTNGNGTITGAAVPSPNQVGGQLYSLTAVGGAGQMFTGWTGSTNSTSPKITFALRSNLVFRANFSPLNLTVRGNGSVSPNLNTQPNLLAGRSYTVTAVPGPGQIFSGWSGSSASSSPTLQFMMTPELILQANFIPDPYYSAAGTYTGLFYEHDEVRQHSSGYFVILANYRGGYSGWVQIGAARHPFAGKLSPDCSGTNTLAGGMTLEFHCGDQTNRVTGRLVGNGFVSTLTGDRAVHHLYNPTATAGDYTMALPGQLGSAFSPAGDGMAFVRVTPSGIGYVSAAMGDGTVMTHAAFVSQDGNFPLYSALYAYGRGSVLGWLSLSNRPTDDISGTVNWIKPSTPTDKFYKSGFTNQTFAFGSRYVAPVGPKTILSLTNGTLAFSGGNLSPDFSNEVKLGSYGRISNLSGNGMSLWVFSPYGVYVGYVYEPNSTRYHYFQGVFLQKQNMARGLLFGSDQTSQVMLTPSGPLSLNAAR